MKVDSCLIHRKAINREHPYSLNREADQIATDLFQLIFWKLGLPWHNRLRDECTPDGDCCPGGGDIEGEL